MSILANIDRVRQEIENGTTSGVQVGNEAVKAIINGMGSEEWETLMSRYASNQAELDRLCGRDEEFNKTDWGLFCLAYIAGDSTCTSETAQKGGTRRSMEVALERGMTELIDAGLPQT